jgi:hypothetical protein
VSHQVELDGWRPCLNGREQIHERAQDCQKHKQGTAQRASRSRQGKVRKSMNVISSCEAACGGRRLVAKKQSP